MATVTAADTTLGVETIQEFRVVTNSFSADYGRAMGGVVSIATKAGTNVLHGSAFEFFRNSKMDARNFFDVGDPAPFTRHQFGAAAGGPIVRNKVFFFGGYERLQEDLGTSVVTAVPTAAARAGAVNPTVRPYLDLYPLAERTRSGFGHRAVHGMSSPARRGRTFCRDGSTSSCPTRIWSSFVIPTTARARCRRSRAA